MVAPPPAVTLAQTLVTARVGSRTLPPPTGGNDGAFAYTLTAVRSWASLTGFRRVWLQPAIAESPVTSPAYPLAVSVAMEGIHGQLGQN
jgi:hypothetical protein